MAMTAVHLVHLFSKMMDPAAPTRQGTAMTAKTPELVVMPQPNRFSSSSAITVSMAASCKLVWKASSKQTQAPELHNTFHGFSSASPALGASLGGGSSTLIQ